MEKDTEQSPFFAKPHFLTQFCYVGQNNYLMGLLVTLGVKLLNEGTDLIGLSVALLSAEDFL